MKLENPFGFIRYHQRTHAFRILRGDSRRAMARMADLRLQATK